LKLRAGFRIAGLTIFVALAVVLLAVGGLWMLAQTDWGGDVIRRIAVAQIDRRIAGQVAVGRLRFGGDRLILENVVLRDPEGIAVARVRTVDVQFSVWRLLRRRVEVRRLELRRPELRLVLDAHGSNLARVFAPAHPTPSPAAPTPAAGGPGPDVVVELETLSVSDGALTVRSQAPEIHLAAIDAEGSARYEGQRAALRADLDVVTEGGRIDAHGDVDLARGRPGPGGLTVGVRSLDLGALMRDMPTTDLALDLDARADGATADLDARAPGVVVRGHGTLEGDKLEARLRIEAGDLAATARSLVRSHLAPPMVLAGRGRIDVVLRGPLARPAVRVAAQIPQLTIGHDGVRELTVRAALPRLDAPTAVDLDLAAASARIGGHALGNLSATVRGVGPDVRADLQLQTPTPIALRVSGRRLSLRAVEIATLVLRTPEATWSLAHPARLAVGGGRTKLADFDLRAGEQTIAVDLDKVGRRGHLRLRVARLDPARLPRLLVPRVLAQAGRVDADLDLAFTPAHLAGRVTAHALGTGLDAAFDLPASWPPRGRGPLRLTLTTEEVDLATAARTIAALTGKRSPLDARGKVRLAATLDGDATHPRLDLHLGARELALGDRPLGDLTVDLEGADDRPLSLRLVATRPHEPAASLTATTPLSLRALVRARPGRSALLRTPFQVDGQIERASLAPAAKLAGLSAVSGGTASVRLAARGTALDPTGTLTVDLAGVTGARFPATDGRVELTLDRRATLANVRLLRLGHPLLALQAKLGADASALGDRARLDEAPLTVRAVVGPLALRRLGLPANVTGGARESALGGTLHADLSVDGSLHAPRVVAHLQASDLKLDQARVGYANLAVDYASRRARIDLQGASSNGGTITLRGSADIDLGLPALLARRIDPQRLPVEVEFSAQKFDLRAFSGLTTTLRSAGGLLDAEVAAHGTFREPHFNGQVTCTHCELQLAGVGDFRDIHLGLHGTTDKVVLDELSAKSGDGNGRLTATLTRDPHTDSYQIAGTVAVKEIPAYQEGQPLAVVSLDAALAGSSGGRGSAALVKVDVREAHLKLSDAKRRQLQQLRMPDDVVIVEGGQPIDGAQAKKLRALAGRATAPPGTPAATPAPAGSSRFWKRVKIEISAPRQLWVNGGGAALELGLEPGFNIVIGGETRIHGQVIVRRGRLDVLGRRFDLKADSTLQFDGAPDHPTLDATAQFQDNKDNLTVQLTAKGPPEHLSISVSSPNRPDLTEAQLYAVILTGHLPGSGDSTGGGLGTTASNEATSLVAGVIAGQLQKTLARHLPLDVLTIDTGSGQGFSGTQLEAGRYVTDRLYVGYIGRVGADPTRYQNRNAAHVEYQLTDRWQIAGEYGDVGTGSADLVWRKNY
jgi:translocation and assembly module TamB